MNTESLVNALFPGKGDFRSTGPIEAAVMDSFVKSIIYGSSCVSVKWDPDKQEWDARLVDCQKAKRRKKI